MCEGEREDNWNRDENVFEMGSKFVSVFINTLLSFAHEIY